MTGRQRHLVDIGRISTSTAISFGLVGVVMTFSVMRFWLSGLTSSGAGGAEAVDGFTRTIGAALFILAWPLLARQGIAITNTASSAILQSPGVSDDLTRLIRAALVGNFALGPVAWIISVITALAGAMLLLGLVLLKIVLSCATAVLFVAMPVAVILWPISELSWIARFAMRSFLVCLLIPLVWVIVFATFAAIGVDAVSFKGGGGILDKAIIQPLTGCALLYVAVSCPKWLMRAAMMGARSPAGGFVGRSASYMAARRADTAIAQHLPASIAGNRASSGQPPSPVPSAGAHAGGDNGVAAGSAANSAGPAESTLPTTNGDRAVGSGRSHAAPAPADAEPPTSASEAVAVAAGAVDGPEAARAVARDPTHNGAPGPGQSRRPFDQAAHDAEVSAALARRAGHPPTQREVAQAAGQLDGAQQKLAQAISQDLGRGDKPLARFSEMAAHEPATPGQREAFRTLAAADNAVRVAGIAEAVSTVAMTDGHFGSAFGAASSSATTPAPRPDSAVESPATPPRSPDGSNSPIAKG